MILPIQNWTHKGYSYLEWAEAQKAYHPAIDLNYGSTSDADLGLPLYPFKSGKVIHTSQPLDPSSPGYGKIVVIKHNDDEYSKYAHLDEIKCKIGDKVTTFDEIATIGKSGTSSPHLHFEIFDKYIRELGEKEHKGFRYYPVRRTKKFVQEHYKNPLEYIMPSRVKTTIVADNVKWIDDHIDWLQDYFLKHSKDQLKLDIDVLHVDVVTKIKDNDVDLQWFMEKYGDQIMYDDLVIYCTDNEDWEIVEKGGYHKDNKVIGKEMVFMHADDKEMSRDFADIEHEFRGRAVHEIMHSLYNSNGKEMHPEEPRKWHEGYDNTHYWDYTEKEQHKALEEIDYDNLNLNPLTKTYMKLIKGDKDEDIFAVNAGVKHHIPTEYCLTKGMKLGLWKKEWETKEQSEVDAMETGASIAFIPNK